MPERENIYLTRAGLARICNLDVRSKRIEEFKPVAFLLLGNRKLPLFKMVGLNLRLPAKPAKELD